MGVMLAGACFSYVSRLHSNHWRRCRHQCRRLRPCRHRHRFFKHYIYLAFLQLHRPACCSKALRVRSKGARDPRRRSRWWPRERFGRLSHVPSLFVYMFLILLLYAKTARAVKTTTNQFSSLALLFLLSVICCSLCEFQKSLCPFCAFCPHFRHAN